ncbi:phage major capsid protein [Planctomicrobium sp. SH661]|uniref:phage major capsid protein n=1 Tax=Planctomicrobium sp. SH661 TaxID=3448124 RepID=UPI003F5B8D47
MPTIKELRERRGSLEARFKEIVNQAETEDRALTQEEETTLAAINKDDLELKSRIERQEQLANLGRELNEPNDRRIAGRGSAAGDDIRHGRGDAEYDDEQQALAFQAWALYQMGEEPSERQMDAAQAVGLNVRKQNLELNLTSNWNVARANYFNSLTTTVPSRGGMLTRPGLVGSLEMAMLHSGPMIQACDLLDTDTGVDLPYPTINDTANEGEIITDDQESTEGDPSIGGVVFGAYTGSSKAIVIPQALLDDTGFDMPSKVGEMFGVRLGRLINKRCTTGKGSNEPWGIVNRATLGKTTASATAITGDEVLDLIWSVDAAYRADPSFGIMAADTVWVTLKKLKSTDGVYLWQRSLAEGTPDTFDGKPIFSNPHMDDAITANKKTVLAGAFGKYKIRRVRSIMIRRMVEKYALQNADGFVAFLRFDGDLVDAGTHPVKYLQQHS